MTTIATIRRTLRALEYGQQPRCHDDTFKALMDGGLVQPTSPLLLLGPTSQEYRRWHVELTERGRDLIRRRKR